MQGIVHENPSLLLYSYGFVPQMSHTSYAPSSVQLPSGKGHGHLYSTQKVPAPDPPSYQQPVTPNVPFVASPTSVPQVRVPVNFDGQGRVQHIQPRSVCPSSLGSSHRENTLFRNSGGSSLRQQGFEACGFDVWPYLSKPFNAQSSLVQLSPQAASLKLVESHHLPENNHGMVSFHCHACVLAILKVACFSLLSAKLSFSCCLNFSNLYTTCSHTHVMALLGN